MDDHVKGTIRLEGFVKSAELSDVGNDGEVEGLKGGGGVSQADFLHFVFIFDDGADIEVGGEELRENVRC